MSNFAPFQPNYGSFIVTNVAANQKIIKIFNYPILFGQSRNLLAIPGISESDLRASLLKGELLYKIRAQEINKTSDIDLLQFNDDQKLFLTNAGVVDGMVPTGVGGFDWQDTALIGTKDNVNTIFTTPTKFKHIDKYKEVLFVNGLRQHIPEDYYVAESGSPGTGYDTIVFVIAPFPDDILTIDYYKLI